MARIAEIHTSQGGFTTTTPTWPNHPSVKDNILFFSNKKKLRKFYILNLRLLKRKIVIIKTSKIKKFNIEFYLARKRIGNIKICIFFQFFYLDSFETTPPCISHLKPEDEEKINTQLEFRTFEPGICHVEDNRRYDLLRTYFYFLEWCYSHDSAFGPKLN